jgi:mono/diheme cytochrome c family protein
VPPTAVPPTSAPTTAPTTAAEPAEEVARPSNPGGPGPAVNLTGDSKAGATLYVDKCQVCHGEEGKGGIDNPGSTDETTPALNPIDPTLVDKDPKAFATNIDLFVEHGSTPEGTNPKDTMPAWGDKRLLTSQQIADVIAYIMSLNKP